jgi:hypothetical protein
MSEIVRILERGYELIWREERSAGREYFDVDEARRDAGL